MQNTRLHRLATFFPGFDSPHLPPTWAICSAQDLILPNLLQGDLHKLRRPCWTCQTQRNLSPSGLLASIEAMRKLHALCLCIQFLWQARAPCSETVQAWSRASAENLNPRTSWALGDTIGL